MRLIKFCCVAILSCVALTACGSFSGSDAGELTSADSGRIVNLDVNDTVTIRLKSNPTTGYNWTFFLDEGKGRVRVVRNEFIPPSNTNGMVGVGGEHVYEVQALFPGVVDISAYYYRPWEKLDRNKDQGVKYRLNIE